MATKVHLQIGLSLVNYIKKTSLCRSFKICGVYTKQVFGTACSCSSALSHGTHRQVHSHFYQGDFVIIHWLPQLWDFTCISTDKCLVLLMDQGTHSLTDKLPDSTNWPVFRSEAIFRIRNLYLPSRDPFTLCWFHVSVFKEWGRRGHMSFVLCRVNLVTVLRCVVNFLYSFKLTTSLLISFVKRCCVGI